MARQNFGGFGGGANMQQLMRQAQKMQQMMTEAQEKLDAAEYEATSGGGMVAVKVSGKRELLSITIILISTVLLAPHNQWVLGTCAILYFIYSIVCIGILNVTSITNYVFMAIFSFIIFFWFLELGRYHSKQSASNQSPAIQS